MASRSDKYLLGYLGCFATTEKSYYGGILVTNEKGMPREFRHTDAVRPSRVQQLLYGDALTTAIGTNSIGPVLISGLSKQPTMLLIDKVGKPFFGDFVIDQGDCALLTTAQSSEGVFMDSVGPNGLMHDAIQLRQGDEEGSSVYAYVESSSLGTNTKQILEECSFSMNIFSPFERVRTVLQHITQAETTKKQ